MTNYAEIIRQKDHGIPKCACCGEHMLAYENDAGETYYKCASCEITYP